MNTYACIVIKGLRCIKGEVTADTTYEAAKKFAATNKLKSTAGIDVYLTAKDGVPQDIAVERLGS